MKNIALQLYSVRDATDMDFLGTLENVAEMGYQAVQFAGFNNHPAEVVKSKLAQVELEIAGSHVTIDQLQNHLDDVLRYQESLGNHLIICPVLPESMRLTTEDYKRTSELLNEIGRKMKGSGFDFGYHNHAFEFQLFDGKTGFDLLYENVDSEYMKMELDCFWASYAGYDPVNIMKKYGDRCVTLHVKDMKKSGDKKVSTEIGNGVLDIESLIRAGEENHVKWFVVEQEDFLQDPLISAKENVERLQNF